MKSLIIPFSLCLLTVAHAELYEGEKYTSYQVVENAPSVTLKVEITVDADSCNEYWLEGAVRNILSSEGTNSNSTDVFVDFAVAATDIGCGDTGVHQITLSREFVVDAAPNGEGRTVATVIVPSEMKLQVIDR